MQRKVSGGEQTITFRKRLYKKTITFFHALINCAIDQVCAFRPFDLMLTFLMKLSSLIKQPKCLGSAVLFMLLTEFPSSDITS